MHNRPEVTRFLGAVDAIVAALEIHLDKDLFEPSTAIVLRDDLARTRRTRADLLTFLTGQSEA